MADRTRWFDRRERESKPSSRWGETPPMLALRCEHGTVSALRARAAAVARQAGTTGAIEPLRRRRRLRPPAARGA
jgi:hypothetical protein